MRKSMDWFLYDRDLRHERVNPIIPSVIKTVKLTLKIWEHLLQDF